MISNPGPLGLFGATHLRRRVLRSVPRQPRRVPDTCAELDKLQNVTLPTAAAARCAPAPVVNPSPACQGECVCVKAPRRSGVARNRSMSRRIAATAYGHPLADIARQAHRRRRAPTQPAFYDLPRRQTSVLGHQHLLQQGRTRPCARSCRPARYVLLRRRRRIHALHRSAEKRWCREGWNRRAASDVQRRQRSTSSTADAAECLERYFIPSTSARNVSPEGGGVLSLRWRTVPRAGTSACRNRHGMAHSGG